MLLYNFDSRESVNTRQLEPTPIGSGMIGWNWRGGVMVGEVGVVVSGERWIESGVRWVRLRFKGN